MKIRKKKKRNVFHEIDKCENLFVLKFCDLYI